jgi:hypothetical protein
VRPDPLVRALTIDEPASPVRRPHGPGSPPNAIANPNCPEPVNFAFLTHSGTPVGPPGPDQQTDATFTPTPDVLLMNPGDKVKVTMLDTPTGYFTKVTDLTTHQSGFMTASVKTDSGTSCSTRRTSPATARLTPSARCTTRPRRHWPTASRPRGRPGQRTPTTWPTTSRPATSKRRTPQPTRAPNEDPPCFTGPVIPGCLGSDADFDGFPYHADWPNGSAAFPTPNLLASPHSLNRAGFTPGPYPTARFETDLPRIEEANNGGGLECDHHTGAGCTNPPPGASTPGPPAAGAQPRGPALRVGAQQ